MLEKVQITKESRMAHAILEITLEVVPKSFPKVHLGQGSQTVIIDIYESICLWSTNTLWQKSLITIS